MKKFLIISCIAMFVACGGNTDKKNVAENSASGAVTPDSARLIAKEAWIYGYPIFYNNKAQYLYAMDKNYADYAGGFNTFKNYGKNFTDADTSVVTPNNDTPYSWAILDLSNEPVVLQVPAIVGKRYYVMQLIDLYTFNFAYVGSRAIGNKAGKYLIAGPGWNGDKPAGIDSVFKSETNLVTILGRTESDNEADLKNVVKIQSQYKLIPLHTYTNQPAPAAKTYAMQLPVWKESNYASTSFINVLNALLQYAPPGDDENQLRQSFEKIGIIPGKPWDSTHYSPEVLAAIREGISDAEKELKGSIDKTTSSLNLFGTRADLKNDYLVRATAAAMGLYGNTKEEAVYTGSMLDNTGTPLTGNNNYILRFTKEQLPKVKFFWSITMYELPKRYLVKNPIHRFSIGDRTKGLKYEPNGDLIIYLQPASPGKAKENNWLPSPPGKPFNYVVRMYGPGEDITSGRWKQPLPEKVN